MKEPAVCWSGLYWLSQLIHFQEFYDPDDIKVGSLNSAMVEVFTPQQSTNAINTNQSFASFPLIELVNVYLQSSEFLPS